MSPLRVVSNSVISSKTNPLGKRSVLIRFLGKSALGTEGLVGRHDVDQLGGEEEEEKRKKKNLANFLCLFL